MLFQSQSLPHECFLNVLLWDSRSFLSIGVDVASFRFLQSTDIETWVLLLLSGCDVTVSLEGASFAFKFYLLGKAIPLKIQQILNAYSMPAKDYALSWGQNTE